MPLPPALPEGTTMLPKGTFDGRVVAITGGGTGLGKAFGLEFARLGATVAVLSRKDEHRRRGAGHRGHRWQGRRGTADVRMPRP